MMTRRRSPPLPLELIEIILNYLPKDDYLFRCCALISRAWYIPSQCALFRSLNLTSRPVARLRTHLRRYPHLQTHIRHVIMAQGDKDPGDPPSKGHRAALTAMFSLMPNLTSLRISFDRSRSWGDRDQPFFKAFRAFLRGTPSINAVDIYGLRCDLDLQQMFLYLENTTAKRVGLQLGNYDDSNGLELVKFFSSTLAVVQLPQVEMIRFRLSWHALETIEGLKLWFSEHQIMFPGLKHLEVAVDDADEFMIWFRDILQPIRTLQLESFRMRFNGYINARLVPRPDINLFNGLHFDHLKFSFSDRAAWQADFYTLLSSKFRLLTADSVHFTELTFAVADSESFYLFVDWVRIGVSLWFGERGL